jgi:NAD(P)H-dependent FMN reductase
MYKLKIIVGTVRPGRKGPAIADWITELAKQHPAFETELVDLAEVNLPFMDEPNHPRFKKYTKEHTMKWSERIDDADAFIFVTPEYNFGYSPVLKNAIDFLMQEWAYKPVAFVSYGGVSAGTRAVQQMKQIVSALSMMPIAESINLPAFTKHINEQGKFVTEEMLDTTAKQMLDSLAKWTTALKTMRS